MARRTSRESVEPRASWWWASAAIAASRSRASARSRSPSTRTRPVTPASADARCRSVGPRRRPGVSASVASGSNRAVASSISRPSCAGPMVCANGATLASTNAAASGRQAQGAVGDEREPPRRQLTRLDPGPAAREPVAPLDRVGQVAAPGLGGAAHRGGELDDRELRDLRAPLPTQRQAGLVPLVDRPDQRLRRVHRRPPRGRPHHLPSLVVLGRLVRPRSRQHGGRVVSSRERERVQGRGHRGTNSTTDHRHPPGAGSPLWTRGLGRLAVAGKVASSAGCGGFETVAARPPQPPCGATRPRQDRSQSRRRQPDSQPAFGPRRGCQPAPPTPTKAPRLDSPGEGQTLG